MDIPQNLKHKIKRRIFPNDCGADGKLKPHRISNYFEQAASIVKAEEFGHLRVVMLRYNIKVHHEIMSDEDITIETYLSLCTKYFSIRKYLMYNEENILVAEGLGLWGFMDPQTGSLKQIPKFLTDLCTNASDEQPEKLKALEGYSQNLQLQIRLQDCDPNGHVNNSLYLSYIELGFDESFIKNHTLKEVTLNFKDGMPYGDTYFLKTEIENYDDLSIVYQKFENKNGDLAALMQSDWLRNSY